MSMPARCAACWALWTAGDCAGVRPAGVSGVRRHGHAQGYDRPRDAGAADPCRGPVRRRGVCLPRPPRWIGRKTWQRRGGIVHHRNVQIDPDTLPDGPALLQQMLRTMLHQQGELHAENDKLRLLIQRLTRHQFGRRSEQLTAGQLQFGLEDLEQTVAENQAGQDAATDAAGAADPQRKPRTSRPVRNHGALPAHLPRTEVVIDTDHAACPCCGGCGATRSMTGRGADQVRRPRIWQTSVACCRSMDMPGSSGWRAIVRTARFASRSAGRMHGVATGSPLAAEVLAQLALRHRKRHTRPACRTQASRAAGTKSADRGSPARMAAGQHRAGLRRIGSGGSHALCDPPLARPGGVPG